MNFLLWILPFFVLILSYFSFRINPVKGLRYRLYALVLFIVFVMDLMQLSFIIDTIDTVRFLFVTFIIADIGWNVIKIRKIPVKVLFMVLGITAYSLSYFGWVAGGPQKNSSFWYQKVIEQYTNHKNRNYILKEHTDSSLKETIRQLSLYKVKKVPFIEELVREYRLPEGYEKAELKFGWSNTQNGVRLDIINNKDTIWTLGEGF